MDYRALLAKVEDISMELIKTRTEQNDLKSYVERLHREHLNLSNAHSILKADHEDLIIKCQALAEALIQTRAYSNTAIVGLEQLRIDFDELSGWKEP